MLGYVVHASNLNNNRLTIDFKVYSCRLTAKYPMDKFQIAPSQARSSME